LTFPPFFPAQHHSRQWSFACLTLNFKQKSHETLEWLPGEIIQISGFLTFLQEEEEEELDEQEEEEEELDEQEDEEEELDEQEEDEEEELDESLHLFSIMHLICLFLAS